MKANTYYTLETNEQIYIKRLGECLNTLSFVFTHHPELKLIKKEERKKTGLDNPHGRIFNGNPFTEADVRAWATWVDALIIQGTESIALQPPAYREGHRMALDRFRETADEFLILFRKSSCH